MSKVLLSEEQKEIVYHNKGEGALLIEASAGSGKTRILTERVRYLLNEKKDKFFSVLCLTFTNKAANEMKERLVGASKLKERTFIGTFHEFCLNVVRSRYSDLGFTSSPHIFDSYESAEILKQVLINNPSLKEVYDFPNTLDEAEKIKKQRKKIFQCTEFISAQKRKLIEEIPEFNTDYEGWGEKNTLLFQDYNKRLREQNAMDYDDILLFAYRILSNPNVARIYQRNYKYILVDEAQDLNYAQYSILKTLINDNKPNIMLVGDSRQAIYGFNGSSSKFMSEDFIQDFGAAKMDIKNNYRSSTSILKLANKIQPNGGVGTNFFEGITEIKSFNNEKDEASHIINKIKFWLKEGYYSENKKEGIKESISYEDIAVLARNKYVFSTLIDFLEKDNELKEKFFLKQSGERFAPESKFMKIFDLGTRIIINPKDKLHYNQLKDLSKSDTDNSNNLLDSILKIEAFEGDEQLNMIVKYWNHLNGNPKSFGWVLNQIEKSIKRPDQNDIWDDTESQKISYDISELKKLWSSFIRKETADNQTLKNFRYFLALNTFQEQKSLLTLATIHTVKGLEFKIVFLIGMNEGVFPDYRATTKTSLKEEKNNLYVAITRAKRVLYISYPENRFMPWGEKKAQKISRFLKKII